GSAAGKAAGGSPAASTPMGPAGLRALLADQPELLEPGLRVYRDESGAAAGVAFGTGVGEIDLLATAGRGNPVRGMGSEKGRGGAGRPPRPGGARAACARPSPTSRSCSSRACASTATSPAPPPVWPSGPAWGRSTSSRPTGGGTSSR